MINLFSDLRSTARSLARRPGYTAVVVLTLALGIGAATAVFSVVNGVLLRPLPYPGGDRIVMIWETNPEAGTGEITVCPPNFRDWREQSTSFEGLAAIRHMSFNSSEGAEPERLHGMLTSASFFDVMGTRMALGRAFTPGEDRPGSEKVVVLSHALWMRRFGGRADIVGSSVKLNGEPTTVIGVAAEGFRFSSGTDLWAPIAFDESASPRGAHTVAVLGRLKAGVGLQAAQSELKGIAARLAARFPDTNRGWTTSVVPLKEMAVGGSRPALVLLLGAVLVVLLIAVANVSSLVLADLTAREHELAVRQALGASRGRLLRLLLTESLAVACLGCLVGVPLAAWGTHALLGLAAGAVPRASSVAMDARVVGFAVACSLLAGLASGALPLLQLRRGTAPLGERSRTTTTGARGLRLRRLLVTAEVALSVLLLAGSALLIRSLARVLDVDSGLDPERVLTARLDLPEARYRTPEQQRAFIVALEDRVRLIPGVAAAGTIEPLPMTGEWMKEEFTVDGQPSSPDGQLPVANTRQATAGTFPAMGLRLVAGRAIEASDGPGAPAVVVVNRTMAERFLTKGDPLGRRVVIPSFASTAPSFVVVGVVEDVHWNGPEEPAGPEVYLSAWQLPSSSLSVVVRSAAGSGELATALARAVRAVDPELPIFALRSMEQLLDELLAGRRFTTVLLGIFAGVALLLAAIGIFGVLAFMVSLRDRELGVRMAVGATRRDLLRLLLHQSLAPVALGLAVGTGAALAASRLIAGQLFEVSPLDPASFAAVIGLVGVVALAASILPATRGASLDPVRVLREE